MKLKIIFFFMVCFLSMSNAFPVVCNFQVCPDEPMLLHLMGCETNASSLLGCTVNGKAVFTCSTCQSSYTRVSKVTQDGSCNYTSYECTNSCTGCTGCVSDADWIAGNAGYQKKATRTCSCNTCNSSTAYRCAGGYYGTSNISGTSGCNACPIGGISAAGDNSSITKCYASPTNGSDSTGTWEYIGVCYYTN